MADIDPKLQAYLTLLEKWNKAYNLSAIRDPKEMYTHHLLDCLAVTPFVSDCKRVLDVGTGAGLPGIVLAIQYPEHEFVLLDGAGKKIRFLKQVKHELKINNIEPVHARAESFHTEDCFNGIISRAVGPIDELINNSKHLLCPNGHWYAMKGTYPEAELENISYPYRVEKLNVPQLNAERHLVIIGE